MARIIIVDDEKNIRRNLAVFFESLGHDVLAAASGPEAIAALDDQPADLVLTDFRMAEMDGLRLLEEVKRRDPTIVVVLMTAFATVGNAVAAMKAGAQDYVTKPFTLDEIRRTLERALELRGLRVENRELRSAVEQAPMLETASAAMRRLLDTARQAAASDATILLAGESGTGKNVLARQIHQWSPRRAGPYVVVNCTTLSEQLLESELFGHMRGSFTGAVKDKPGRLEAAHLGSVFLDEIADLTPALQTKFLRFVQEQSFERIGGDRTIQVDARIIAASNRDLEAEVAAHRFRDDLFYRLDVIALRVPPLREREDDVIPLARWMLRAAGMRNRRSGLRLNAAAEAALRRYRWPGNLRELRNAVERAAVLCRSDEIAPDDLPDSIFRDHHEAAAPPAAPGHRAPSLEEVEREHIRRVLTETATLEEAADTLGINVTTLWRKRRRYGIE